MKVADRLLVDRGGDSPIPPHSEGHALPVALPRHRPEGGPRRSPCALRPCRRHRLVPASSGRLREHLRPLAQDPARTRLTRHAGAQPRSRPSSTPQPSTAKATDGRYAGAMRPANSVKRNFARRDGTNPDEHAAAFDAKIKAELDTGTSLDIDAGQMKVRDYAANTGVTCCTETRQPNAWSGFSGCTSIRLPLGGPSDDPSPAEPFACMGEGPVRCSPHPHSP